LKAGSILRVLVLISACLLGNVKLLAGEAIAGIPISEGEQINDTISENLISKDSINFEHDFDYCNSEQIITSDCIIEDNAIENKNEAISAAKNTLQNFQYIDNRYTKQSAIDSVNIDSSIYIPLSEYTIAGTQRYTIDNSLPKRVNKIKPWAAAAVGASYFGILASLHIYQMNTLWNDKREFRFFEDINQDYFADKFGHFFGAYFAGYGSTEVLVGAGFSYNTAYILGGVMGLLYQTYVEIMDGFGKNWGFSPSDFYADAAGFIYYMSQHYIPFLQNFTPKATYFPARWYDEKPRKEAMMFIDDYSSWTMWLSANMHNLTPDSWKWPRWLNLAVGYAVRNLRYDEITGEFKGEPRFSIALDYNLAELLPDSYNFLNWLKQSLNYFKFPAPAIEFGDVTKLRMLYPFVISFGTSFKF